MTTNQPRYVTRDQAAEDLVVNRKTIDKLISRGELPAVRVGRTVRIARTEVDAYLKRNAVKPRSSTEETEQ